MLQRFLHLLGTEKVVLAATFLFIIFAIFNGAFRLEIPPQSFLVFHALLEIFAVTVSFSITFLGWMLFPRSSSKRLLYAAAIFLAVGLFDLAHILTYDGMYRWSSPNLSTWYWIIARLIESIGLLIIILINDRHSVKNEREIVFGTALFIFVLLLVISINWSETLPTLIVTGVGTTGLKNAIEYFAIVCKLIVLIFLFKGKNLLNRNDASFTIICAIWLLILSEVLFTLYRSVFDFVNLFGHVLKAGGYFYIMKGIYLSYIEAPYIAKQKTEDELLNSRRELQVITDAMGEGILVLDKSGNLTFMNPEAERLLGWKFEELNGKFIHDAIHYLKEDGSPHPWTECKMRANAFVENKPDFRETDVFVRKDGTMFYMEYTATSAMDDGENSSVAVVFRDITKQRKKQEQIQFLALHDDLTGLPNRYHFRNMLTEAISSTNREIGIFLLDVDRFKHINDTLGHEAGDLLLCGISERLRTFSHSVGATVGRMGGDEFLFMTPELQSVEQLDRIAESLLQQFAEPFPIYEVDFHVTPSVGISVYPMHGQDESTLIKNADIAMYNAKTQRNQYKIYHPSMNEKSMEKLHLENDLRGALDRRGFNLHYQPQVDSKTNQIIGVEALLRWKHPIKGWVPPCDFIPLAEEIGMIVPIEQWVLREACTQMRIWQEKGIDCGRMSVNISGKQFHSGTIAESVAEVLRVTRLRPNMLDLEVTESVAMYEKTAANLMQQLKHIGVYISIDDFGTGYSSLSRLKNLPIDRVKIDQSFVRGIKHDSNGKAIVTAIIAMSQHLGLDVIAEGVETEEELTFLNRHHCFQVQGYYFSKPLPAQELEISFIGKNSETERK